MSRKKLPRNKFEEFKAAGKLQVAQIESFIKTQAAAKEIFDRLPKQLMDVLMATKFLEVYQSDVELASDFEGLKRLAKLGLVSQKALPSAKRVAAWKKQISAASRTVRLNKWQYNEGKSVYERDTGGRREELVTACVHAMLDLLDWTKFKEDNIKKMVSRIFWFHFPKDKVFERNSKVTNAIKSFKEKKRRSSRTTRQ